MKFDDLCLGVACKDGYYKFDTNEKILTDKTKDIPEGTYLKPNFTPLTHQEIADYLGMSINEWHKFYLDYFCINRPLTECWAIEDKLYMENRNA